MPSAYIEKGPMKAKRGGKGAYEGQNEDQIPIKKICCAKKSKCAYGIREP